MKTMKLKEYKEDFYNAIVNDDDKNMFIAWSWLDENWDNDNNLFVDNYPFNYSFDELYHEGFENIVKETKLENIRKWAK